ncbi:MAG: SUMF1/EgtB/PvdO family nonheme iron enzyme [Verrucomicrobia bacterium]|nr:SUMF1/EgtB/PvdO family nonheme iron enzyme [Verrucomicrobiota bacterium]MCH8512943.1 SUMF1/EgtB/PvdO family nonheme iron enzyme [Kiritimatiellia bacterium]
MKRSTFCRSGLIGLTFFFHGFAADILPLVPETPPQDEAAFLAAALEVQPEILEGGYRQYDLVFAEATTWEDPNEPGTKELVLRLILPAEAQEGPYPLVAYIHGGHFMSGSPLIHPHADGNNFGAHFLAVLEDGFAVASLGYRLAREAGWPAPVSDSLAGLRFLRLHGDNWHLDTNRIAVSGHSAGARAAGLLGMVPQDRFHRADLPWGSEEVPIAATWLWAGSILSEPTLGEWEEFGKPRWYSVPRLHFGEHPAHNEDTRQRLRVRHNSPHLSMALPPLHLLRGERDYGGDHSDAERTARIWEALGVEANLMLVPGGHSAAGPTETFVAFMRRHLIEHPFDAPPRNRPLAAEILLEIDEPFAAVEVLNAHYTLANGTQAPEGDWISLSDGRVFLRATATEGWDPSHIELYRRALRVLGRRELEAARSRLEARDWFRAEQTAKNVLALVDDDPAAQSLAEEALAAAAREAELFNALHLANKELHGGKIAEALERLAGIRDQRASRAWERIFSSQPRDALPEEGSLPAHPSNLLEPHPKVETPVWATDAGVDVYGIWADLDLGHETRLRFRWVESGAWELPETLWYRNRADGDWTQKVEVAHDFWLAETPVTHAQWLAGSGNDPAEAGVAERNVPVTLIDYLQIEDWLNDLSESREGLILRLPTEEEWLQAATLGGAMNTQGGTNLHSIHAGRTDPENPGPVGVDQVVPDLGGFLGLVGGVQEWTGSPGRHSARFTDDRGRFRALAYPIARGGAWSSAPEALGFEVRNQQRHGNRQDDLGFRPAIGGGPNAAQWMNNVERR